MAASVVRKRTVSRRKLHILRTLTSSKSVKKNSIIMDAFLYIYQLKPKLEAIRRDYLNLMEQSQVPTPEVKVDKIGKGFSVRVSCENGRDLLVPILEAFDEMGLNVLHAKISCNHSFAMEALVEAQNPAVDAREVSNIVLKATGKQGGEERHKSLEDDSAVGSSK